MPTSTSGWLHYRSRKLLNVGISFATHVCPPIQAVEHLYSEALDVFPDSAMLCYFVSQYVHVCHSNRHIELLYLKAAEVSHYSVD